MILYNSPLSDICYVSAYDMACCKFSSSVHKNTSHNDSAPKIDYVMWFVFYCVLMPCLQVDVSPWESKAEA